MRIPNIPPPLVQRTKHYPWIGVVHECTIPIHSRNHSGHIMRGWCHNRYLKMNTRKRPSTVFVTVPQPSKNLTSLHRLAYRFLVRIGCFRVQTSVKSPYLFCGWVFLLFLLFLLSLLLWWWWLDMVFHHHVDVPVITVPNGVQDPIAKRVHFGSDGAT